MFPLLLTLAISQPPAELEKLPADTTPTKAAPSSAVDPTPPRYDPTKNTPRVEPAPLASVSVRTSYEVDRRDQFGRVTTTTQHGSGTVVKVEPGRFLVLTCDHVTRDDAGFRGGRLSVTPKADGKRRPAKLLHHDKAADLALLEVKGDAPPGLRAAVVANSEAYAAGTAVVKAGFPGAGEFHLAKGVVTDKVNGSVSDPAVLSTIATALSRSGDSGGGLFRESDGALVGVVWGGRPDGLRASRLREIHALLTKGGMPVNAVETLAKAPTPVKDADKAASPVTLTVRGGSRDVLGITRQLKAGKTYRVTVEEVATPVTPEAKK